MIPDIRFIHNLNPPLLSSAIHLPYHKNPCPGGLEIYNFGGHFFSQYFYISIFFSMSESILNYANKLKTFAINV